MADLTKEHALGLRETLSRARSGRATLGEVAAAHDLAAAAGLAGTSAELREHLRRRIDPARARSVSRDVLLGVASGALTHYLLKGL